MDQRLHAGKFIAFPHKWRAGACGFTTNVDNRSPCARHRECSFGGDINVNVNIHNDSRTSATARSQGRVDSFSPASGAEWALLPAQNATGNFTKIVQRVPVRIALEAGSPLAERLRPGLSVEVSVDTRNAAH